MSTIEQLTILAPGLIGGSLGLALKNNGFARHIVGWGHRTSSLQQAVNCGAIDRYELDLATAIEGSAMIVMATPTQMAETLLMQLAPLVSDTTIITDVASVKGNIQQAAERAFGSIPPYLVLAHPIAGSEQRGIKAAHSSLFQDHQVIVTPTEHTAAHALQTVVQMWESSGASAHLLSVAKHDAILAASSHLPHLLAFAFMDSLAEQADNFHFAAGGFRDFSRIASSDPDLWQEIVLANDQAILTAMDQLTAKLATLRQAIATGDANTLQACFTRAKTQRDQWLTTRLAK